MICIGFDNALAMSKAMRYVQLMKNILESCQMYFHRFEVMCGFDFLFNAHFTIID